MNLLDARSAFMRHTNMNIGFTQGVGDFSTIAACESHHGHVALVRSFNSRQNVARIAAAADGQQHIARSAKGTHLFRKYDVEVVVVGNRGQDRAVSRQRYGGQLGALTLVAAHKLRCKVLCISGRATIAASQHLAATGHAGQNSLNGGGDGFG